VKYWQNIATIPWRMGTIIPSAPNMVNNFTQQYSNKPRHFRTAQMKCYHSMVTHTFQLYTSVFFVNEDDDENFRWRRYFNFRWRDENCDDNSDNFVNVTKTATKISVFSLTRWWRRRKLSERRKPFRRKFEICTVSLKRAGTTPGHLDRLIERCTIPWTPGQPPGQWDRCVTGPALHQVHRHASLYRISNYCLLNVLLVFKWSLVFEWPLMCTVQVQWPYDYGLIYHESAAISRLRRPGVGHGNCS